jgi:hypothetical protein
MTLCPSLARLYTSYPQQRAVPIYPLYSNTFPSPISQFSKATKEEKIQHHGLHIINTQTNYYHYHCTHRQK